MKQSLDSSLTETKSINNYCCQRSQTQEMISKVGGSSSTNQIQAEGLNVEQNNSCVNIWLVNEIEK